MIDVVVRNEGTIVLLYPKSSAAEDWFQEHLTDPETQWWGKACVCGPRYVQAILEGMTQDGLEVSS